MQPDLSLLLLTILKFYNLPPPLVSNSSCLFIHCQFLYANYSTILLYFPKCCTVRLKCFIFVFKMPVEKRMDKDVVRIYNGTFSSVLSCVRLFATPWTAACQASLSITKSWSLLKFMSIESVMPSNHLILCHPFLLLPSIIPNIRVFSNESTLQMRWPKYWSFSFTNSPSNEYSGLISFRMDWLALLAVQGTLRSLLQHHSSKSSLLQRSAFFIVQLSPPYMTPGKTIVLTRRTFAGKVMSLLFNMLSRLVIAFLPRSKCVFISWLQSPFAVISEPKKINSVTVFMFPHLLTMK